MKFSTRPSCRSGALPRTRPASAPRPVRPGKDTRGMLRQHQFEKVELVSVCAIPRSPIAELERMTGCAEEAS